MKIRRTARDAPAEERGRTSTSAAQAAQADAPARRPREGGGLPTVAVITMARDEGAMIARWVDHYAAQVGADNVFVVDDHTADGSTDGLPCQVIRLPYLGKYSFEPSRMGIVSGLASSLLFAYDAVMFVDADEFVVADPKEHETLRHFAAAYDDRDAVGVLGYNVVHLPGEEPLRFDRPFLQQRSYAKFVPLMCKPSFKQVPAGWVRASHGILMPYELSTDLYMFHMKFADRDLLLASAARRHHLNQSESRAKNTSWAQTGDEMVALLDEVRDAFDPDALVRFRPPDRLLTKIVQPRDDHWKAVGDGQVLAMRKRPFTKIPSRFTDLV